MIFPKEAKGRSFGFTVTLALSRVQTFAGDPSPVPRQYLLTVVICSPWIIKSFALKKESQRIMCALCVSFEVDLLKVLPVLRSFPTACPQAISARQVSFTAPPAFWIERASELRQRCCSYHNCPQGGDTAPWPPGLLGKQTPENLVFLVYWFQKTMPEERPQGVSLSSSFL